ncbi:MAG: hypothetical protein IKR48_03295 [Kiritimatiellae bacterium]|nr:hypothetical protein [Kiritimatiellia bacterium]
MLGLFTLIHPLVDACSIGVLAIGGMTLERVIVYNALAFALQLPLGVLFDFYPRCLFPSFLCGTGLAAAAVVCTLFGMEGWSVLSVACLGNALFHLSAGKQVLESHGGRSGPIGLFISTGALGLMAGQVVVEKCAVSRLSIFAVALAACTGVAVWKWYRTNGNREGLQMATRRVDGESSRTLIPMLILFGLFVLIAWRSWAGLLAGRLTATGGVVLVCTGALVTWSGKVVGGYLAERMGRWLVTGVSVCGSLALAFLCSPENPIAWLVLLFVAQLATGPVLSLAFDRTNGNGGTAFGLNCLALFTGSLW